MLSHEQIQKAYLDFRKVIKEDGENAKKKASLAVFAEDRQRVQLINSLRFAEDVALTTLKNFYKELEKLEKAKR